MVHEHAAYALDSSGHRSTGVFSAVRMLLCEVPEVDFRNDRKAGVTFTFI